MTLDDISGGPGAGAGASGTAGPTHGPAHGPAHGRDDARSFDVRTNPEIALNPQSIRSDEAERAPFDRVEMFLDVTLDVRVELGRTRISIQRALNLQEGSVVELDKLSGDPLDVVVNGRLVARAEAVVVGDRFGVRIVEVVPVAARR